jgi:hypothetical protein
METLVDSLVLAAVERGNRHPGQLTSAVPPQKRDVFTSLRRLEREGLLVRRRRLVRMTRTGAEALAVRRLELAQRTV